MSFSFKGLSIPDVILINYKVFKDSRGHFSELYKSSPFNGVGITENFVQDNESVSSKNVLRGLHYQLEPESQAKIINCIEGKIYDVAVDIRRDSPYFKRWIKRELSGSNAEALYIPPGFAHGFLVLSDSARVIYKVSREYSPEHERGIIWNDPEIGVEWPLEDPPILSQKDASLPPLNEAENNFNY